MSEPGLVDVTGRPRSPAATPGHWAGCVPPNKGLRYPADPPTVEEIILVMREAGLGPYADRLRGLIAILWRAGLRISEALALTESDLDPKIGSVLVRAGKGGLCRIRHRPPLESPTTPRCDDRLSSGHHRRVIRPPPDTVSAIGPIKLAQIHPRNGVQNEPRQVPVWQPIPHIRRKQDRLITVSPDEVQSHPRMVLTLNPPDDTVITRHPLAEALAGSNDRLGA